MAKNFLVDINLNQNELQNGVIQNLASDPNNAVAGQVYFNTQSNKFRVYNGTSWDEMGTGTGAGTVTSVGVSNATDGGLTVSGSPVTSAGTISVGHSNVLAAAVTASGVYPIKIDKNGHITEVGTAIDFSTYATLASPTFTGTPTAPTAEAGTNTTQIATTAFVNSAISGITGAMIFKGTVGAGGTVDDLPTTNVKIGDTYKVSVAGTYAEQAAKVGDLFIATATTPTWTYVPSGDEVETQKYTGTITGNGTTTSFTVTHNLGSRDVIVNVYDGSNYEDVIVDIVRTSTSALTVSFASAPASGKTYKVVVVS